MFKRLIAIVLIIITCNFLCIYDSYAEVVRSAKSGEVNLIKVKNFFAEKDNIFKVSIGEKIKFECMFYITEWIGKDVVWAGADIINTTSENVHYAYYVSFFDKDMNLIGCQREASFGEGFEPIEMKTQLGSCLIELPISEIAKIKYYNVVLYESENEIGKE